MMERPHPHPGPGPAAATATATATATARNLVYHVCVAKGTIVLAEHSSPDDDDAGGDVVRAMAAECLQHVPPYHSRFSHCSAGRRYALLMEPDAVLVAVADEALPKATVYALLEHARDDCRRVFKSRGLSLVASDDVLLTHAPSLRRDTAPVLRRLVAPLVGIPHNSVATEPAPQQQPPIVHDGPASPPPPTTTTASSGTEETSADKRSFCPLLPKAGKHEKKKVRDQAAASAEDSEAAVKVRSVAHKGIDVMVDNNNNNNNNNSSSNNSDGAGPGPGAMGMGISVQRCASGGVGVSGRSKGQQMAQRMWWRNVRVVLLLDVAVCAILFAIWLGICNGFNCISNN